VTVTIGGYFSNVQHFRVVEDVDLRRIMLFGDSIFHWAFTRALQDVIDEDPDLNTLDLIVLDQGRNGETLSGDEVLDRWRNAIDYGDPDVLLLLEGTMDVQDGTQAIMADIQQGLIQLVDEALLRGQEPVLCTLLPRVGSFGDLCSPTTGEFNAWLTSYADGMGLSVVDIYDDFLSNPDWETGYFDGESDKIHPNANGKQRMAELIADRLRQVYLTP
jgi:lysophospholipase L1-like esterase